jgi:hypothetical protein
VVEIVGKRTTGELIRVNHEYLYMRKSFEGSVRIDEPRWQMANEFISYNGITPVVSSFRPWMQTWEGGSGTADGHIFSRQYEWSD